MSKLYHATINIRYDLKGALLEERSQEMAKLIAEKSMLEEEKKSVAKSYKYKIDGLSEKILKIGEDMGLGFEIREEACKKRKNYAKQAWEYIDNNTGEILKEVPFEGNDFQTSFDDEYDDE